MAPLVEAAPLALTAATIQAPLVVAPAVSASASAASIQGRTAPMIKAPASVAASAATAPAAHGGDRRAAAQPESCERTGSGESTSASSGGGDSPAGGCCREQVVLQDEPPPPRSATPEARLQQGGACGSWRCAEALAPTAISEEQLSRAMEEVSASVCSWKPGAFAMVRHLEEASRNYGQVDAMRTAGGQQVAVKRMPLKWAKQGPREFQRAHPLASEQPWRDLGLLRILSELGFAYACSLIGAFADSENMYVVTSLACPGDLFTWSFSQSDFGREREVWLLPLAAQALRAVGRLHDLGIGHRDLSLENLLLEDLGSRGDGEAGSLRLKVIDFAMSTLERPCTGQVGKPSYRPPEMYDEDEGYDPFLVDSFSLGVTLFTMATKDYPWTSTKPGKCDFFAYAAEQGFARYLAMRRIRRGGGQRMAEALSPAFCELLEALLALDPKRRVCLGEQCFTKDLHDGLRRSAWDLLWLVGQKQELATAD